VGNSRLSGITLLLLGAIALCQEQGGPPHANHLPVEFCPDRLENTSHLHLTVGDLNPHNPLDPDVSELYPSHFPFEFTTSISLPDRVDPQPPTPSDADPIVPQFMLIDGALRARDYMKFTVFTKGTHWRSLGPSEYVVRPGRFPHDNGVPQDQTMLEGGQRIYYMWEIDAPGGGGLPPGLYQVHVHFDTTQAPEVSRIPRVHVDEWSPFGFHVKEAKSDNDRDEEMGLMPHYQGHLDPIRTWVAIEYAWQKHPDIGNVAYQRATYLLALGELDRLLVEYDRLLEVNESGKMRRWFMLGHGFGGEPLPSRADIETLCALAHGQAGVENVKELKSIGHWNLASFLYRYRGKLAPAVIRELERLIDEGASHSVCRAVSEPYELGTRHALIDEVIAAGGLDGAEDGGSSVTPPRNGTQGPSLPPPVDHEDTSLPPSGPRGSRTAPGAFGTNAAWIAVGLLGAAALVTLLILLRRR